MMLLNCAFICRIHGAYIFIEIILLLSNLNCSGSTFTVPLLHYRPPLRLHPFVRFQSPPLFQNHFNIPNTHNFQTTENLKRKNLNIEQQTAKIYTYFPTTTIRPSIEFIFYDNHSVKPTHESKILRHPLHGGPRRTKSSNHVPDFKDKVTSHQHIHETRKFRPYDNSLITNTDLESEANILLQENIPNVISISQPSAQHNQISLLSVFRNGLEKFERKFYAVTFEKLIDMTASGPRAENAISFVQSPLFLQLLLLTLSIDRNADTQKKIDSCIGIENNISSAVRIQLIKEVVSMLPNSTDGVVFRWSTRLLLNPWGWYNISENFKKGAAALQLHMDQFNGTETPEILSAILNRMVEEDSKGAIHNTFDPNDLSGTVSAVFLTTIYLRSSWRIAPTLLNGTRVFRDSYEDPNRTIRMIRVIDMMRYANLIQCEAEALEVFYTKAGLSLLILVPHGSSLRRLAGYVAEVGLGPITSQMTSLRVAADLPLYTLRMSLLLPSKLEGLGLSDLLHTDNTTDNELKMSHGLQRLMFWAEAGRNAFKDDGLEWDEPPHMKIVVDRPYLFFVRWNNMTIMNGNFVL